MDGIIWEKKLKGGGTCTGKSQRPQYPDTKEKERCDELSDSLKGYKFAPILVRWHLFYS